MLDNKHYKKINIVVCFVFGVSYYNNPKWNRMLRNKKRWGCNKMKFLHWHFVQPFSIAQQCGVTNYH
jgi:hypothetical protein